MKEKLSLVHRSLGITAEVLNYSWSDKYNNYIILGTYINKQGKKELFYDTLSAFCTDDINLVTERKKIDG